MSNRIIKILGATVSGWSSVVGKHEGQGPYGNCFDFCDSTDEFGTDTWEKAENAMQKKAVELLLDKKGLKVTDFDAVFAGDLQNQCVGSSYGLLEFDIPYFGLYGACSTAAESMMLAAMGVSAGYFDRALAVTSSHYLAAERQYRTPIEYGAQRSPTSQWTVTGSGAFCIDGDGRAAITEAVAGIVIEKGINDATNMGAAMAPAAADTLLAYFRESGRAPADFDAIVTGDLGIEGSSVLRELLLSEGLDIRTQHKDCGIMIYDRKKQDKHAGGSGCGCSAVMMAAHFLGEVSSGRIKKMLFVGTGAMMSPSSILQGLTIPAIAHLICIEYKEK